LDIPREVIKELELEVRGEIPYPFYIASEVLERKPVCGRITLQNKEEVFLLKPLTSEKEVQVDLTSQKIKEKDNQITQLNSQMVNLQNAKNSTDQQLNDAKTELAKIKNDLIK